MSEATDAQPAAPDLDYIGPKSLPNTWLNRLTCRVNGHTFVSFSDGFKRRCIRCSREEWVMSNPYPGIGEPKYTWQHMDWDRT